MISLIITKTLNIRLLTKSASLICILLKKNFRGVCIPKGGLKQSILNNTRQLKLNNIVNVARNKFNNF